MKVKCHASGLWSSWVILLHVKGPNKEREEIHRSHYDMVKPLPAPRKRTLISFSRLWFLFSVFDWFACGDIFYWCIIIIHNVGIHCDMFVHTHIMICFISFPSTTLYPPFFPLSNCLPLVYWYPFYFYEIPFVLFCFTFSSLASTGERTHTLTLWGWIISLNMLFSNPI